MSETIPIGNARGRKASEPPAAIPEQDTTRTLHRRMCAITAALTGGVAATSKNQYKAPAVGIDDVEEALGPLLAEHGVVTEWGMGSKPERSDDGWMVHLRMRLVNADDKADATEWADWWETGSNVSAACSFGRKGAMKAPFHLAAKEDEERPAANQQQALRAAQGGAAVDGQRPRKVLIEPGCPDCGGSLAIIYADGKRPFVGHAEWKPGADACKWRPAFDVQAQWIRDAEASTAAGEMMGAPMTEDGPPSGTVTRVELVATAIERGREYKRLDAVACEKLLRDHGWSGDGKESQWIATITEGGKLISLISDLNSRIASCPVPIPM